MRVNAVAPAGGGDRQDGCMARLLEEKNALTHAAKSAREELRTYCFGAWGQIDWDAVSRRPKTSGGQAAVRLKIASHLQRRYGDHGFMRWARGR